MSELRFQLHPEQLRELTEGSAISPETIEAAGLWCVREPKDAAKLLGYRVKLWKEHVPALIFPYHLPGERDPVVVRGKPMVPFEIGIGEHRRVVKYVQPAKTGSHLYFTPSLLQSGAKDASRPLLVTEGEKKALSADSAGYACIGLGGVTQWSVKGCKPRKLLPEWNLIKLEGREVFVCFDRDALNNKDVAREERALGQALLRAGAKAYVVRFPAGADKLDDFLASLGPGRERWEAMEGMLKDAREHAEVKPPAPSGSSEVGVALTDLGNAERFVAQHRDTLAYCPATKMWRFWNGKYWNVDKTGAALRRAMLTVRSIRDEAAEAPDDDTREAILKHAHRSESERALKSMLNLATGLKGILVDHEEWDTHPHLLCTPSGVVDLETGRLMPHDKDLRITQCTKVDFEPGATHQLWDRFVETITGGDVSQQLYLQTAAGYSLTGSTREDKLFILYGQGGRGKSTYINALCAAMGSYAMNGNFSTFAKVKLESERPKPELASFMGTRLVMCSEVEYGSQWNEATVKAISGGDPITVRKLHSQPVQFKPAFKLWVAANDPPMARGDDSGIWRRLLRFNFDQPIPRTDNRVRERMSTDPDVLKAVLAWAVEGARIWFERGIVVSGKVSQSTADYQAEMDTAGTFLMTQTSYAPNGKPVSRKLLYEAYKSYCDDEGAVPVGNRRFTHRVRRLFEDAGADHGYETNVREWGVSVKAWRGIAMVHPDYLPPGSGRAWSQCATRCDHGRNASDDGDLGANEARVYFAAEKISKKASGMGGCERAYNNHAPERERERASNTPNSSVHSTHNIKNNNNIEGLAVYTSVGTSVVTSELAPEMYTPPSQAPPPDFIDDADSQAAEAPLRPGTSEQLGRSLGDENGPHGPSEGPQPGDPSEPDQPLDGEKWYGPGDDLPF